MHTGKENGITVIDKDSSQLIFIYNNVAHTCQWGDVETNQSTFIHVNENELEFQLIRLFYARQARRYYVFTSCSEPNDLYKDRLLILSVHTFVRSGK